MHPSRPRPRLRVGLSRIRASPMCTNARITPRSTSSGTDVADPCVLPPSHLPKPNLHRTSSTFPNKLQSSSKANCTPTEKERLYFSVLYTKRSKKKHKSYLDGFIILTNDRHVELQNEDGKRVTSERVGKLGGLKPGNTLEVSTFELEVQEQVKADDYVSGRVFLKAQTPTVTNRMVVKRKPFKPLKPKNLTQQSNVRGPLHDPLAPNAFVLSSFAEAGKGPNDIPVVLDPCLARHMRIHQKAGIAFMYRCVLGVSYDSDNLGNGAILADEMGLGKSLQAIALIWTLLKQGPSGPPMVKKAIVVCPASLVTNWVNEVKKWLGNERLQPVWVESGNSTFESKQGLAAFVNGNVKRLLIISYEMFRSYSEHLYKSGCGLVICDEGHRLKSSQGNKTIEALRNLPCRRRIILTGTPVQNDLDEFFAVCEFVNPGCLGTLQSFRNVFAHPIIASRDSNATQSAIRLGEARAQELSRVTSCFVLRRTSDILEKYLPPKTETAIFCRLVPEQEEAYRREANNRYISLDTTRFSAALSAINYLRKICSHPTLVAKEVDEESSLQDEIPVGTDHFDVSHSSKMLVTLAICDASFSAGDKVILVSNFTSTLDLIQDALIRRSIKYCRLDGATNVNHRGDIVKQFNKGRNGDVFLLSAKAGGVGLNLIGANRLILFDPDWNPATDLQAMARIWRDGQKKPVFVYRLLCTGTIEEKIFQRQLFKGELQSAVDGEEEKGVDAGGVFGGKEGNFSAEQLKDLFQYHGNLRFCDTLQVLKRSQLAADKKTLDDEDDFDDDPKKLAKHQNLLQRFSEYQGLIESESIEVENLVMCGEDEVLNAALNADLHTHGIVSYLYTKKCGSQYGEEKNASVPTVEHKSGSGRADGSRKRKLPKLFESDSEESSDEDVDKALAKVSAANEKRCKQTKQTPTWFFGENSSTRSNLEAGQSCKPLANEEGQEEDSEAWDAALNDLTAD
ncbi:DNA helicase [Gracilaria domingensis]|nr:DNA helicase [Gracilaria domingensis]